MITSSANPQVKRILQLNQKAKLRREEGVFPAEGLKMFLEAPPEMVEKVYLAESLSVDERLWEKLRNEGLDFEIVADSIFERMSDTRTPQGF